MKDFTFQDALRKKQQPPVSSTPVSASSPVNSSTQTINTAVSVALSNQSTPTHVDHNTAQPTVLIHNNLDKEVSFAKKVSQWPLSVRCVPFLSHVFVTFISKLSVFIMTTQTIAKDRVSETEYRQTIDMRVSSYLSGTNVLRTWQSHFKWFHWRILADVSFCLCRNRFQKTLPDPAIKMTMIRTVTKMPKKRRIVASPVVRRSAWQVRVNHNKIIEWNSNSLSFRIWMSMWRLVLCNPSI